MSGKTSEPLKPNEPHRWTVTLSSILPNRHEKSTTCDYIGTVDGALAHADELESEVDFEVTKILITRGERRAPLLRPKSKLKKP